VVSQFAWPASGEISRYFEPGRVNGLDLSLYYGDLSVRSAAAGTVSQAGRECCGGKSGVVVEHERGFASYYGNLSEVSVTPGQELDQGDSVGVVADDDPRLHFELADDAVAVDPLRYLPTDPTQTLQLVACPDWTINVHAASSAYLRFSATNLRSSSIGRVTGRRVF
jgi:murein DD-endopeptidase MepM/ murein hydrolase activator NlpD